MFHFYILVTVFNDRYFSYFAGLGGSNFADAFLEVEEEQDYPPTANAGEDIIIHLPKNEVTLHGNGSSDDHGMYDNNFTILIIL